ncbi:hypothetical protein CCACVL1_05804 [Corchorus capsularis]|uniref:Uncharacterized protein n=1 Tax=Corchorus capsularis TaxID=210143 RepID=A0A1R3JIY9_COCAP|nr:hypothetical protein CCACVL1_05804 [Corchorus capsularis]
MKLGRTKIRTTCADLRRSDRIFGLGYTETLIFGPINTLATTVNMLLAAASSRLVLFPTNPNSVFHDNAQLMLSTSE